MGKIIPIVVTSENEGGKFYKSYGVLPVVKYVDEDKMKVFGPIVANGPTIIREYKPNGIDFFQYITPLKPDDLEVLRNPTTTDYGLLYRKAVAASANGHDQTSTLVLNKQYYEITTATATSADAAVLPVNPTVGDVKCVINQHATVSLWIFPGVGDFMNGGLVNVHHVLAPGRRAFYVCVAADNWRLATDYGR